jgi:hypothetical protein
MFDAAVFEEQGLVNVNLNVNESSNLGANVHVQLHIHDKLVMGRPRRKKFKRPHPFSFYAGNP